MTAGQHADGKWYPPTLAAPAAPAAPASAPPPYPGGGDESIDAKSFVRSLYTFNFDQLVAPKVLRVLYAMSVVLLSIGAVVVLLATLASGEGSVIVFGLIVVPILYAIYLIFTRVAYEMIAAFFRMADDVRAIRRGGK